ncbi:hypothetical protein CGRA01v4_12098 [Colletotrichum graminicola]|uniref:Mitochondrial export protein Som1 n=1 Tax=Colletotrichum graminicola (strain M1.001 / M2 / FGSC 10212) TaxID=645133 RepID=E3QT54_COLGM|nr:uncharacterized protein GLRG_09186 [Colletotrichum graminicola M1.001]EFQ34042.1 hypothetical protein GLRG_09186 [Colletotrichum graminicola M1.001]WDK20810.1 hypothetical protein CGRA01v4_12098 [Colletotrichum graminicola]
MTPPCKVFPVSELELHVQANVKGKKRKLPRGADVDLTKCALKEMTQFRCYVDDSKSRDSPVRCWPIHRLFRQCRDKKGTFTIETTAWEGSIHSAQRTSPTTGSTKTEQGHNNDPVYHQWSQAWQDE